MGVALEELKKKLCPHCHDEVNDGDEWKPLASVSMDMGEIGTVETYMEMSLIRITRKGAIREPNLYISMIAETKEGCEFFQLADSIPINYCPFCGRNLNEEE